MELDRRQREFLRDVRVFDSLCLIDLLPFDPFRGQRRRGDGRTTAKGLELGVDDVAVGVDLKREESAKYWSEQIF